MTNKTRVWKGPDIRWQDHGLHLLAADELRAIDEGLRRFKAAGGKDFSEIDRRSFPLAGAEGMVADITRMLESGGGFALLRGLQQAGYDRDDMALAMYAIGAHVGTPIVQSHQGELLGHVIDLSDVEKTPRGYHTGGHMGMHTDSCDVVALMCLQPARSGGASRIVNAQAVCEAMERDTPELAAALRRGFHFRRMDQDAALGNGVVTSPQRIPIYRRDDEGRFTCYYIGGYVERAARAGDVQFDATERAALDELNRLAESPDYYLDMQFSQGDVQFLNNRVILHGRTHYEDESGFMNRRHLARLWLHMPTWPPMPPAQVFHSALDRERWGARRTPWMDLPSSYLEAKRRLAEGRAAEVAS